MSRRSQVVQPTALQMKQGILSSRSSMIPSFRLTTLDSKSHTTTVPTAWVMFVLSHWSSAFLGLSSLPLLILANICDSPTFAWHSPMTFQSSFISSNSIPKANLWWQY